MARSKSRNLCVLLLSTLALSFAITASESPICTLPFSTPKHHDAGKDTARLLRSFQLNTGYFFGGEDIQFTKDDINASLVTQSFSLLPLHVDLTADSTLLHVAATLTLSGGRTRHRVQGYRRRHRYGGRHSVFFYLDGYYSSASSELCLAGSGTYTEQDGSVEHLRGVLLKLRVPNPSSLSDPFVTGHLKGASFGAISLVAYVEGDTYIYGRRASCPLSRPSSSTARGAFQVFGRNFSCARLKENLASSFEIMYGSSGGAHASASPSSRLLQLQESAMHVRHLQCTEDGAVRAYATFSNDTETWRGRLQPRPSFTVDEKAVVAEGHWDPTQSMLCLRACRVVRSGPSLLAVQPRESCSIGMSFWFPGIWTIRDRSVVAGVLWNTNQAVGGGKKTTSGSISLLSIDASVNHRSNFSDVKYEYNCTLIEKAKKQYLTSVKNNHTKKVEESFLPPNNFTYNDFEFHFYEANGPSHGDASPITIGSAMVYGNQLAADDSFSQHAMVDAKRNELLNMSYDIRQFVSMRLGNGFSAATSVRPGNMSYSVILEERRIAAEGVFDPATGTLCMVGCRELHDGSTDCEMLITIHFRSLDSNTNGYRMGSISSLRNKGDRLFFDKVVIGVYGNMYTEEVSEAVSRMDMESAMLVVAATLPCVFTALQILHAKRNPDAAAATSVTMLVVLALGYVAPLVVSSEALFASRRIQYMPFQRDAPYELNKVMLRVPTLIAFVLQLRLIQLALSGRASAGVDQGKAEASSTAEKRALWMVCLPFYLLGGALTIIVHMISNRAGREHDSSGAIVMYPEPATLWQDLASSTGLALDGFLLPQVAMNALSTGAVRAISPWFYVGGTVVRAMPHVYDVIRAQGYAPGPTTSYVYASTRDDRFGVAWDIVVPCVTILLAVLLFLQQRRGGRSRKPGGYEMASTI